MILPILTYPNPQLREVSEALKPGEFGPDLKKLADNMLETMYHSKGIGLAAPQVGVTKRFLVIDCRPKDEKGRYDIKEQTEWEKQITQPLFIANPKIISKKGKVTFEEGCLSVPSFYETVERAAWIELEYQDLEGQTQTLQTDGLLAIVVQHEMDHLEGTLFIDRISFTSAQRIKKQIEKNGYPNKKAVQEPSR